jgi:hypothetical protein
MIMVIDGFGLRFATWTSGTWHFATFIDIMCVHVDFNIKKFWEWVGLKWSLAKLFDWE